MIVTVPLSIVWQIRQEVMYPDKPLSMVQLPDDKKGEHIGLKINDTIIGIISVFTDIDSVQFRKFAVLPAMQGKGFGQQLLQQVFRQSIQEGKKRIWCNARTSAIKIYEKNGMQQTGNTWMQNGHTYIIMEKVL